jgi:hypothetical protein
MKFVGFEFTKFYAEKTSESQGEVAVNTNVNISSVEKIETSFGKDKEDIFKIKFSYSIEYKPEFAKIELTGTIVIALDTKTSKELSKGWEDKKFIPDSINYNVFNLILKKSNIKSLELEDELNLPNHIPLPTIKKEDNKS